MAPHRRPGPRSIAIVAPNYRPETNAAAKRITAIAEHLQSSGWRVKVVTLMPHYPDNKIHAGFDVTSPDTRAEGGIEVVRIRPWIVRRDNLLLRLLSETLFCLQGLVEVHRTRSDVLLASSPYMFLGPIALAASRWTRRTFIWDVRDLTWLYPRAAGKRTFGMDLLLERAMRATARGADGLVTATEGLFHYFSAKPDACMVLPNGVSEQTLHALGRLSCPGRDLLPHVVYAGLFGYNHGLITVLEAARLVPDVWFTLAGDGPERPLLEEFVARHELRNVRILGYMDRERLFELYEQATMLVSHVRKNPLFRWTQPAKLWEYMAAQRPVIHAGEGEAVRILREHGIGLTVPPDDPAALADAVRRLAADPDGARRMAREARAFVEHHRRHTTLVEEFSDMLDRLVPAPARSGTGIESRP